MHPVLSLVNYKRAIQNCDWQEWDRYKFLDSDMAASKGLAPLPSYAYISMLLPTTPLIQRRAIARIAERYRDIKPVELLETVQSKPRIGYIGSKLDADHVSGLLFTHLFPHHDTKEVDILVFLTRQGGDTENARRLFHTEGIQVFPLHAMSDEGAALFIRDQNLDLLISTDGWNDNPRPEIVARRPSRKQAWWQGTATTSSAPWMDYIFTDLYIDGQEKGWRSEEAFYLPQCYYLAGHVKNPKVGSAPTRASVGVPADKFIFSCLNTTAKITPDVWMDWMEILQRCSNAVLMLLDTPPQTKENLLKKVPRAIAMDRILFAPRTDPWSHIERAGVADLFLDTHYNGAHTTLAEALWMEVPAISVIGNTMSSRVGYSMLNAVKLSGLAVKNRQEYKDLAVLLYNEPLVLREYRNRLKETKHQADMFDMRKQALAVESFVKKLRES